MGKKQKESKQQQQHPSHHSNNPSSSNNKQNDREYKRLKQQEEQKQNKKNKKKQYAKTSSSSEDLAFNDYLQREHQFTVIPMQGDGNCLFRSLAHQLSFYQSDEQHMTVRKQIVAYIQSKKEYFILFYDGEEEEEEGEGEVEGGGGSSFDDYLQEMKEFGTWGGHFELYAAAQCFYLSIHVHQWQMPKYIIQCTEENNIGGKDLRMIHLSYHGGCHFNSVVPLSVLKGGGEIEKEKKGVIDEVTKESLFLHVKNKDSASSQQGEAMEAVEKSVQWATVAEIRLALEWNENNVENAIDLLCTNLEAVQFALREEETTLETAAEQQKKSKTESQEIKENIEKQEIGRQRQEQEGHSNQPTKEQQERKEDDDIAKKSQRFSKVKIKKSNKQMNTADDGENQPITVKSESEKLPSESSRRRQISTKTNEKPLSRKERRQMEKNKNCGGASSSRDHSNHTEENSSEGLKSNPMREIMT